MKHVLVTGANGHVGSALTELLVQNGYRVRAGVRNPDDPAKTDHLRKLGAEICRADILQPDSLAAAADGLDGVFHLAAMFQMWAKDPKREIIEPTVQGGLSMLRAAKAAGVKKVIFTSSIAAIGLQSPPDQPLSEADWNDRARHAYVHAKTEGERAAWSFAREQGLNMVAINPATILGPGFRRHTPSTRVVEMLLGWKLPVAPPFGSVYVDVRDVAWAHLAAYENPSAAGRYVIANGPFVSMIDLARLMHEIDPSVRISKREMPDWMMQLGVLGDWLGHALLRRPRLITREVLAEYAHKYVCYSHEKATRELGWQPMDFKKCLADTMQWIRNLS